MHQRQTWIASEFLMVTLQPLTVPPFVLPLLIAPIWSLSHLCWRFPAVIPVNVEGSGDGDFTGDLNGTFLTFSGDRTLVSNQLFFLSGVLPFFAPFFPNFLGLFFLDYVFYVQPLRTISYKLKMNRKNATGKSKE